MDCAAKIKGCWTGVAGDQGGWGQKVLENNGEEGGKRKKV